MNILGFGFTKINGERKDNFRSGPRVLDINFKDIQKEEIKMIKVDAAYTISFTYTVNFSDPESKKEVSLANIIIEGKLTISLDKNEDKEFSKTFKKKEMNEEMRSKLFNVIIRKCTPRAIDIEDHLGLPSHISMPTVSIKKAD
jgi:hypothetical protein